MAGADDFAKSFVDSYSDPGVGVPAAPSGGADAFAKSFADQYQGDEYSAQPQEAAEPGAPDVPMIKGARWGGAEELGEGLTLGLGHRAMAADMAARGMVPGASFGERYKNALDYVNAQKAQYEAEQPGKSMALKTVGSIPTVGTAMAMTGGLAGPLLEGTALAPIVGGEATGALSAGLGYAGQGAQVGALTHGLTGSSWGEDLGYGAGTNLLLGPVLGRLASNVAPEVLSMAKKAFDLGVDVKLPQMPGAPGMVRGYAETSGNQIKQLTKAAAREAGLDQNSLNYDDLFGPQGAARKAGGVMEKITSDPANVIPWNDKQLIADRADLWNRAQSELVGNPTELARVENHLRRTIPSFAGDLTGKQYQNMTKYGSDLWNDMTGKDANLAHYAGEIKGMLDDAWSRNLPASEAADFNLAKGQYRAARTLQPALDETTQQLDPRKLYASVMRKSKTTDPQVAGNLGTLADVAKSFLSPNMPSKAAGGAGNALKEIAKSAGPLGYAAGALYALHEAGSMVQGMPVIGSLASHPFVAAAGAMGYKSAGALMSHPEYARFLARGGQRTLRALGNPLIAGMNIVKPTANPFGGY